MAYVKCGKREVRKGCPKCGRTSGLYRGHDTDHRDARGQTCFTCQSDRRRVLVDRFGRLHECVRTEQQRDDDERAKFPPVLTMESRCSVCTGIYAYHSGLACTDDSRANGAKHLGQSSEQDTETTTEAPTASTTGDDGIDALRRLLLPSQDAIDTMVRAAVEKVSVPIVVRQADPITGELSEIEGLHHAVFPQVVEAVNAGLHVFMTGPAGTGKSTIANQAADTLELGYGEISLSPQTGVIDLLGYRTASGDTVRPLFREIWEQGGLFHFDEVDKSHPSILPVINAATGRDDLKRCAFPDGMVEAPMTHRCMASANTFGLGPDQKYVGSTKLDAAFLNRFGAVIEVGYDHALEDALAKATGFDKWHAVVALVRRLRARIDSEHIPHVLSTRNIVAACRLSKLASWTWEQIVASTLRRGLSDPDWHKLTQGVSVTL